MNLKEKVQSAKKITSLLKEVRLRGELSSIHIEKAIKEAEKLESSFLKENLSEKYSNSNINTANN
jgi:hypothetical protein